MPSREAVQEVSLLCSARCISCPLESAKMEVIVYKLLGHQDSCIYASSASAILRYTFRQVCNMRKNAMSSIAETSGKLVIWDWYKMRRANCMLGEAT